MGQTVLERVGEGADFVKFIGWSGVPVQEVLETSVNLPRPRVGREKPLENLHDWLMCCAG